MPAERPRFYSLTNPELFARSATMQFSGDLPERTFTRRSKSLRRAEEMLKLYGYDPLQDASRCQSLAFLIWKRSLSEGGLTSILSRQKLPVENIQPSVLVEEKRPFASKIRGYWSRITNYLSPSSLTRAASASFLPVALVSCINPAEPKLSYAQTLPTVDPVTQSRAAEVGKILPEQEKCLKLPDGKVKPGVYQAAGIIFQTVAEYLANKFQADENPQTYHKIISDEATQKTTAGLIVKIIKTAYQAKDEKNPWNVVQSLLKEMGRSDSLDQASIGKITARVYRVWQPGYSPEEINTLYIAAVLAELRLLEGNPSFDQLSAYLRQQHAALVQTPDQDDQTTQRRAAIVGANLSRIAQIAGEAVGEIASSLSIPLKDFPVGSFNAAFLAARFEAERKANNIEADKNPPAYDRYLQSQDGHDELFAVASDIAFKFAFSQDSFEVDYPETLGEFEKAVAEIEGFNQQTFAVMCSVVLNNEGFDKEKAYLVLRIAQITASSKEPLSLDPQEYVRTIAQFHSPFYIAGEVILSEQYIRTVQGLPNYYRNREAVLTVITTNQLLQRDPLFHIPDMDVMTFIREVRQIPGVDDKLVDAMLGPGHAIEDPQMRQLILLLVETAPKLRGRRQLKPEELVDYLGRLTSLQRKFNLGALIGDLATFLNNRQQF